MRRLIRGLMISVLALGTTGCGTSDVTTPSTASTAELTKTILPSPAYLADLGLTIDRKEKLDCFNLPEGGGWCGPTNLGSILIMVGYFKSSPFMISGAISKGKVEAVEGNPSDTSGYSLAVLDNVFFLGSTDGPTASSYTKLHVVVVTEAGSRLSCPLHTGSIYTTDCVAKP
jgi:hypothetical protein